MDCRDEMPRRILSCQDGYYDSNIKVLIIVVKEVKNEVSLIGNIIISFIFSIFQKSKIFQNPKVHFFRKIPIINIIN